MGIFAPRNVLGPEQGEGGGVCLLRTTKPGQLGPTFPGPHLWPQTECVLNICYLFWCLGCGLIGLSHENIFSPWLECTGICFPLIFQWRHTYQNLQGDTRSSGRGFAAFLRLPAAEAEPDFPKRAHSPGQILQRRLSALRCQWPLAPFGDFPKGLSKQEAV